MMIRAPAAKAHPDHQRRIDPFEAFLEIGAVLFIDAVQPLGLDRGARGLGKGIEITDHCLGHDTMAQCLCRTAIRRHHARAVNNRRIEQRFFHLCAPN